MRYKNVEMCRDRDYLFENLNENALKELDRILEAYYNEQIDICVPGQETGEHDLINAELIVNDTSYMESGFELLAIKWVEDWEDTGYLVECFENIE